jgi:hypothetical protein
MESGTIPIGDMSAQVEVVAVDASSDSKGIHANEAEPQSEDWTGGDA